MTHNLLKSNTCHFFLLTHLCLAHQLWKVKSPLHICSYPNYVKLFFFNTKHQPTLSEMCLTFFSFQQLFSVQSQRCSFSHRDVHYSHLCEDKVRCSGKDGCCVKLNDGGRYRRFLKTSESDVGLTFRPIPEVAGDVQ